MAGARARINNSQVGIIPRNEIDINQFLGSGCFGEVWKGIWTTIVENGRPKVQTVAIKMMKGADKDKVNIERDRMAGLNHPNVVKLLGVVERKDIPWLVMEYVTNGDVLRFLRKQQSSGGVEAYGRIKIAWGIARGMDYLHSQNVVHGDLAARNCLLGQDYLVKVGDLGYYDEANSNFYEDYYNSVNLPCPIRWMAPENLPSRINSRGKIVPCQARRSKEGDIWAFGIVLFELWSQGETPFQSIAEENVSLALLEDQRPWDSYDLKARDHIWCLISECSSRIPRQRPQFLEIVDHFERYEDNICRY